MKEMTRTLIFVGVALVVTVIAIVTRPSPAGITPDEELGKALFPDLQDPLAVTDLEIVKFDEGLAQLSRFRVAQVDGVWSIVSQDNYPVDAKDQMKDVATLVGGLEILGVEDPEGQGQDTKQGDIHKLYGVVEPDREKINVGTRGVGTLLILKDSKGKDLARLIIGNKVEREKEDQFRQDKTELHYVRRAGQDRVYIAKLDVSKLSTRFEDWIERDLLKLDPWNIKEVELDDYAIVTVQNRGALSKTVQERSRMTFAEENSKWTLKQMLIPDGEKQQLKTVTSLAQDEELNESKLNDLKNALDDLKIAGVERRPASLRSDLATGQIAGLDDAGQESLIDHGFFPGQEEDSRTKKPAVQIYSDSGEIRVGMNTGVEYLIHFGSVSGSGESSAKKKESKKEDSKNEEAEVSLNRYVLVTTRVNEDLLEKPALKPLPVKPEPSKTDKKPGDKKTDDKKTDDKKTEAAEQQKEEKKKFEEERKKIEEENKKAQEEYDNKVKEAQKKVREFNARFSEWYFIISEDVYKKIHLTRSDVINKKEKPKK
jgi:hypothetical protein